MKKAFIFDVDGTIVDTKQLHINSWVRAFREFGIDMSAEKIRSQLGRRATEIAKTLLPKERLNDAASIAEKKKLIYQEYYPQARLIPMTKELFALLRKDNIKIALATSAARIDAEFYINNFSLKNYIDALVTAEDVRFSKPHPEIFLKAAVQLRVKPNESVAVGDSPYDMASAKNAGMLAIGVLTGGYPRKELKDAGAHRVYQDIQDLYKHLEEISKNF